MKQLLTVIGHEARSFFCADRATLVVQGVLILSWGMVMSSQLQETGSGAAQLWWLFFPVVAGGAVATTVFTAERMSGSMEILLTCGLARGSILYGKTIFVFITSVLTGFMSGAVALGVANATGAPPQLDSPGWTITLFLTSALLNANSSAVCAFCLDNPRFAHLANMLVMGMLISGATAAEELSGWHRGSTALVLLCAAVILAGVAKRVFHSERVVQPYAP